MTFNIDKFISDMFGNSKTDNNTNAKKRITKKKVAPSQNMQDGGRAAMIRKQKADRIATAAKKEKAGIDKAYSRSSITSSAKKEKAGIDKAYSRSDIASRAKKEKGDVDKAYNRSSALSTIKKDTNLVGNNKASNKKVVVTKAQLEKSGLNLRDYMNMIKSQKTGRDITRDSRFDTPKVPPKKPSKTTFYNDAADTKMAKKPTKKTPVATNEYQGLNKMTNTIKKNKDGKHVIKNNKDGKYVIKKGY
jgi:hypothetical protein